MNKMKLRLTSIETRPYEVPEFTFIPHYSLSEKEVAEILFNTNSPFQRASSFDLIPDGFFEIKNVIFHDPATIVFWGDGTKTVVKATDEAYDPEKGLSMAIARHFFGDRWGYYNIFRHWLKKYKDEPREETPSDIVKDAFDGITRMFNSLNSKTKE